MGKVHAFLELVKFEHTVFALPFAYLGMMSAQKRWPGWGVFVWVTVAMVGARTAGMTLNRIIDIGIDAKNPRTRNRPSVTGAIPMPTASVIATLALFVFFVAAYNLNPLCLKLSPIAVLFLSTYHYVKRFSFLCHFVLGLVLGIAPLGGWLAVTGAFSWTPVLLSLGVLFWVAGFDILYSLQDYDFDKSTGLHSVPVRFGLTQALEISKACHAATVVLLALFGAVMGFGVLYGVGVAMTAVLLFVEHRLISDSDLTRINTAFFSINGWVGILLFVFTFLEIFR